LFFAAGGLKPPTVGSSNVNQISNCYSRWVEKGVIERLFRELQLQEIIKISVEKACLDSTSIKVHPDACGAQKKEESSQSGDQREETTLKAVQFCAKGAQNRSRIWLPQLTVLR
jgi:hypothetical protein